MALEMGKVHLENYNSNWKIMFEEEKENLKEKFGEYAISIEHIGSTAIEGLSAKPIIDISVGVNKLEDFKLVKDKILQDYKYSVKEDSVEGEILVRKGPEPTITHFIHVMEIESDRYKNTIIFRDYLRDNPVEVKRYERLKKELAKKYFDNRIMYTSSKKDFIEGILLKAKAKI